MADIAKFFAALAGVVEAEPTQQDFVIVHSLSNIEVPAMHLVHSVLTPPITDPTRPPRRTAGPRLLVRSIEGVHLHALPASDRRNLTGRRARLFVAEWEIWLIDENGQEHMLEHHGTGDGALHALPRLLRQVGLLDEHGTRPAAEGGVSDAA